MKSEILSSKPLVLVSYRLVNSLVKSVFYSSSARRFFCKNYPHPLFHNHRPNGKSWIRGAPVQFKVVNGDLCILGVGDGAEFLRSFNWPKGIFFYINHTKERIDLANPSQRYLTVDFAETEFNTYRTISPYLALNQEAYNNFNKLDEVGKRELIERRLSNHILSAAKWCNIWVRHRIKTRLIQMRSPRPIKIKKISSGEFQKENFLIFVGMDVMFETNTNIPDFIGIGRFVSRGYGTVVKYG